MAEASEGVDVLLVALELKLSGEVRSKAELGDPVLSSSSSSSVILVAGLLMELISLKMEFLERPKKVFHL